MADARAFEAILRGLRAGAGETGAQIGQGMLDRQKRQDAEAEARATAGAASAKAAAAEADAASWAAMTDEAFKALEANEGLPLPPEVWSAMLPKYGKTLADADDFFKSGVFAKAKEPKQSPAPKPAKKPSIQAVPYAPGFRFDESGRAVPIEGFPQNAGSGGGAAGGKIRGMTPAQILSARNKLRFPVYDKTDDKGNPLQDSKVLSFVFNSPDDEQMFNQLTAELDAAGYYGEQGPYGSVLRGAGGPSSPAGGKPKSNGKLSDDDLRKMMYGG